MTKIPREKKSGGALFKNLLGWAAPLAGGWKPVADLLKEGLGKKFDHFARLVEKQAMRLILKASLLLTCALLMGIGLIFILIDYLSVPRGIACLGCGLLGFAFMVLRARCENETGDLHEK